MDTVDKVLKLEKELEDLENDLKKNINEQVELHCMEHSLKKEIQAKEEELEQLESARE